MSFLLEHGGALLLGATVLLAAGCLLVACCRQPLHRQRMGEAVGLALLCWLLVAPVPLPRMELLSMQTRSVPPELTLREPARSNVSHEFEAELPVMRSTDHPLDTPLSGSASRFVPVPRETRMPPAPPLGSSASLDIPAPVTGSTLGLGELVVWTWLTGAVLSTVWLLLGAWRLRRLVRSSEPAPEWLVALADKPARARIRIASRPLRPLCAGVLRPLVLLPRELCRPRHASLLRHVLRHELAHVRQGDCRTQWLFAVLLPLLFFHPLLWWLRRQVRRAAEIVADEVAASASCRAAYARELIALAEQQVPRARALGGVAVFREGSEFYRRMEMLLRREKPLSVSCSRFRRLLHLATFGILVGVSAGIWGAPLAAQDPVRGDTTRRELEELREERDRLARELEELRAKVAQSLTRWSQQPGFYWDYTATEVEVREGQTLDDVLREYFTEVDDALIERTRALNPGLDEDRLRPGQKIKVPSGSWSSVTAFPPGQYNFDFGGRSETFDRDAVLFHTVAKGETIDSILRRYHCRSSDDLLERVRELNPDLEPNRLRPGQRIRVPAPISGWVTYNQSRGQDYRWGNRDPFLQDPETGEQRQLQKTYVAEKPSDPFVHQPAGGRSVLTHEPVLDLVTRAVDLRGELEIAIARLEEIERRGEATRIAEVEVRTAERKLQVVRRMIEGELKAAKLELKLVHSQMRGLDKDDPRYLRLTVDAQRLELRIDTLQSAL